MERASNKPPWALRVQQEIAHWVKRSEYILRPALECLSRNGQGLPIPTVAVPAGYGSAHSRRASSAQREPSIMAGAFVLPALMLGIADRSQTRSPLRPLTRMRESKTAFGSLPDPIRHVPLGW